MRNSPLVLFSLFLVVVWSAVIEFPLKSGHTRRAGVTALANAPIVESYGKLPLSFEANQGQTDSQANSFSRGSGCSLFLTSSEAVLSLKPSRDRQGAVSRRGPVGNLARRLIPQDADPVPPKPDAILRMKLAGANPSPQVTGLEELPGKSNYFVGNDPAKWRTNVPSYAKVRYENVYSGIDLVYYGNQRQSEYDLVVSPGADPRAIGRGAALRFFPPSEHPHDRDSSIRKELKTHHLNFQFFRIAESNLRRTPKGSCIK